MSRAGLWVVAATISLLLLGVVLNQSEILLQSEADVFLDPPDSKGFGGAPLLAGVVIGFVVFLWRMLEEHPLAALRIATASMVLVVLGLSNFPNFVILEAQRSGVIGHGTVLSNAPAIASVAFPLVFLVYVSCRWILGAKALQRDVGTSVLLGGFAMILLLGIGSAIVVLGGEAGIAHTVVASLMALLLLLMMVTLVFQILALQDKALHPYVQALHLERERVLRLAHMGLGLGFLVAFFLAFSVPAQSANPLGLGATWILSARSHLQAISLLGIPLFILGLRDPGEGPRDLTPLAWLAGPWLAAAVLAGFRLQPVLVWLLVLLPLVAIEAGPRRRASSLLVVGFLFWALGNYEAGAYNGFTFPKLLLEPGEVLLWLSRTAAVVAWMFALVVALQKPLDRLPILPRVLMLLTWGLTIFVWAHGLLAMDLWDQPGLRVDSIGAGSWIAHQVPGVQAVLSILGLLLVGLSTWMSTWFTHLPVALEPKRFRTPSDDASS